MTQTQSPAEKLGYQVGDKFVVLVESTFKKDSIVKFEHDDGSHSPLFTGEGTEFHCGPNNTKGAYVTLSRLRKLEPKELYKIGDKFRVVTAICGGLFDLDNEGKQGSVHSRRDGETVYVRFDCGVLDFGLDEDLALVEDVKEVPATTVKEKLEQIEKLIAEIKQVLY